MNWICNNNFFLITCFFIFSTVGFAQNNSKEGVGEVSEIIIPTSANIRNNFNLLYDIHFSREGIPTPSFWYKIIFKKDCSFEFTLIPISEEDKYDFYFYKVESNLNFCDALNEEKIISCNTSRVQKKYIDKEQSEKFREGLVDIKSIQVKAGDAIYIEVFSATGNDCGHVLDFRTTENSFVVKVVNDNCSGNKSSDTTLIGKYTPLISNETQAMEILRNMLCPPDKKPLFVSSIQVTEQNVKVQQKLDFTKYSKPQIPANLKPKEVLLKKTLPIKEPVYLLKPDSSKDNKMVNQIPLKDSVKKTEPVVIPNPTLAADTQKRILFAKSTADLNSLELQMAPIGCDIKKISTNKERNSTRLEVDNALFLLLKEDLKRKMESTNEQLSDYSKALKKTDNRDDLLAVIKETKSQRADLQIKLKDTEQKLKKISKLLKEERNKKMKGEESVFAKGACSEDLSNNTDNQQKMPKGIVYRVQIGVYKNPVSVDIFKGLTPVYEEVFSGGVKYSAGSFTHFQDAKHAKDYIRTMGLADSFVVAFYNGKRVTIEEAKGYEK